MRILYLSSHAILEYDQTSLWTGMGHDVFSIGAYTDPAHPAVDLRPAIDAPYHADLAALCHAQRVRHEGESALYPVIDWAKADLHPELIEWAEAVIVDCYPESWIAFNWRKFGGKRVIWRTIGQSGPDTEAAMGRLRRHGLEIVRYSPAEERAYGRYDWWAGQDAVIRFAKDPADWSGWTGERAVIGNLAQHDTVPHGRDAFLHWDWLTEATKGLPLEYAGPNSEKTGGLGALDYEAMRAYLRRIRAYIYTGTVPASYTLGLIEAMMTGVPVVSIGKAAFGCGELFEGDELVNAFAPGSSLDTNYRRDDLARELLDANFLQVPEMARVVGELQRAKAIELFGIDTIRAQWAAVLGSRVAVAA